MGELIKAVNINMKADKEVGFDHVGLAIKKSPSGMCMCRNSMGLDTPRLWSFNEKHVLVIGGGGGGGGVSGWTDSMANKAEN